MTKREKIMYWFLTVITFGFIHIYWKTKKIGIKNELSQKEKISLNIEKLISLLGDKENIDGVDSTHTKVKIKFLERDKINVQDIKNMKGISGVFITSNYIQIIVGNEAKGIEKAIEGF